MAGGARGRSLGRWGFKERKAMAAARGITLYHSPASRAFTAYWMLEELGVPFKVKAIDIRKGEQKTPAYLKLNPAGKVPTLTDGEVVVSENPAIGIYLADRYGYGTLAPRIDDPDRGAYLKWMVFSTAVVDPVATLHEQKIDLPGFDFSFGAFDDMVQVLTGVLRDRRYLLGDRFSAADVVLGGTLSRLLYKKTLPEAPELIDYNDRLTAREAFHRAADATWPSQFYAALG
jgi:glutathione S-transferase